MKETGMFKRLLSLVLLVCMVVSAMPVLSSAEEERYGYLIVPSSTVKNRVVNFRPSMKAEGNYLDQLPEFTVVKILSDHTQNGSKWYYAQNLANSQKGYFLGTYVQEMTADQIIAWQASGLPTYTAVSTGATTAPDASATPGADLGTATGYVRLVLDSVNMRSAPEGTVLTEKDADKLPLGLVLPIYGEVLAKDTPSGKYAWALINYDGKTGYIRSDCYLKSDAAGNLLTATAVPGQPTAGATTPVPETTQGYIVLIENDVYLRETPAGTVLNPYDKMPLGEVLPYTVGPVPSGKYEWVKVTYHGLSGYVRSDCYAFCDENGFVTTAPTAGAPTAGVTPTPTPAPVYGDGTYGRTTMDDVMFRKVMSKNGDYWARLPRNWVVEVLGSDIKGDILWYKVQSGTPSNPNGTYTGYIHSDYLTIVAGSGATAAPNTGVSGYAVVTVDGINLRATAGGTAISVLRSNTVVNVISAPTGTSANDWYYVELNGVYGYLPATGLRELLSTELENFTLPATPAPTVTPSPTPAYTGTGYVKLIKDKVNLRKTPGGTVLTPSEASKLPLGLVLAYSEGPTEMISGYNWVKVTYGTQTGYIRSDCYEQCYADGTSVTPTATPTTTAAPGDPAASYIRLTKGGVNLRSGPWGISYGQLGKGIILPCYGTQQNGSETWYIVYSAQLGTSGYILSTMAVPCNADGTEIKPVIVPTVAPGGSTTAPTYTGYIATSISAVWVRSYPEVDASTVGKVQNKGTVLPLVGPAVTQTGSTYAWYPVLLSNGSQGYVRSDCAFELAQWQLDHYNTYGTCPTPTPGPATPPPGNSEYVKVFGGSLWVRQTPSTKASTVGQLADNSVTKYYSKKVVGDVTWYEVKVDDTYGWIHGGYARILTNAEYYAWKGTEAPASTPTAMPDPSTFSDLGLTTIERVKIRNGGSMNNRDIYMIYDEGSEFTYLGSYTAPTATNQYYWFKIKYQGVTGWVRGDCVRILTMEEKQMYLTAGNPDAPKEATYRTLSKGSTGEDVTALQNKLVEKGYLTGSFTSGYYDTATENAVIAFQRANGLTVDGLAGELTQHALFNTVPEGTYDGSSTSVTLFPVEYIDWFTGGIQTIWKAGTVAIITDIKTGISFRAQRLYGDNHADAEPLTVEDTDAICRIFGVSDPQDISDYMDEMQSWRRRPLWVTIGNRTFAASMYGVPHNYSGDRIPDNGYTGQFCVHFTNSKTHGSGKIPARVDYDYPENGYYGHQSAIKDAYNQSISGNK